MKKGFFVGEPTEVLERLLDILYRKFGGHINEKGYKVLDKHVRIIQGDGINIRSIREILQHIEKLGFSADNLVFGSGGKSSPCSYSFRSSSSAFRWFTPKIRS